MAALAAAEGVVGRKIYKVLSMMYFEKIIF